MLKNEFYREIVGSDDFRGYDLLNYLMLKDRDFNDVVSLGLRTGFIRKFNDLEWDKISSIDYIMNGCFSDFFSFFKEGYNIGASSFVVKKLYKKYNDVDIVYGRLPILDDVICSTDNSHWWLETDEYIIDPSLLLMINPLYRDKMGYIEDERIFYEDLIDRKGKNV